MSSNHGVTESTAAGLLSDLISYDSQNPPGREGPCAEFIREWLIDRGINARLVHEPFPERPQVMATIGEGEPTAGHLVLNGHIDVVPPGDPDRWSVDPFGGAVKLAEHRVYGRGASDMKSGLAAMMLAAQAVTDSGVAGTVTLTFGVGEETADPGTKHLVEGLDADAGIVLEPTELEVHTAAKGLAWYVATITGEPAHSSRPHEGLNAVQGVFQVPDVLADYDQILTDRTHPLLGRSLCTPTMLSGGTKENILAEEAEVRFDRRFLPDESVTDIDCEMHELFDPIRTLGYEVTVQRTRTYEAAEIPVDADIAQIVRQHAAVVSGVPTAPAGKEAATDQRNLVNDAGIPAIIWGPGTPAQSHTIDECARTDRLVDAVEILARTIIDVCN